LFTVVNAGVAAGAAATAVVDEPRWSPSGTLSRDPEWLIDPF
jgi:hypothetical protein